MNRHADEDRIAGELSAIPGLTRGELIGLWEKAHGRPPPKGLSRRLLEYSAAYRVQVKAFGGLKPMVRRKLRAGAASGERTSKSTPAPCRSRALSPGTRLVREWHGVPHTAEVLERGPRHPAGAERKGRHRLQDRRTMNRHADEDPRQGRDPGAGSK